MVKYSYELGAEVYKSKTAAMKRCKEVLNGVNLGEDIPPEHFSFLVDVLKQHKESADKIGCGVARLYVDSPPPPWPGRNFWIERTDGSRTDFSYVGCFNHSTHYLDCKKACRLALDPQIQAFKLAWYRQPESKTALCPILGVPLLGGKIDVDHTPPQTFERLFCDWIKGQELDAIEIERGDGTVARFKDEKIAGDWLAYHNARALLRVTSKLGNLKQGQGRAVPPICLN